MKLVQLGRMRRKSVHYRTGAVSVSRLELKLRESCDRLPPRANPLGRTNRLGVEVHDLLGILKRENLGLKRIEQIDRLAQPGLRTDVARGD